MVMGDMSMSIDLAVIGAGAGGLAAALRGAQLGLDVALVDLHPKPGGNYVHTTCLPYQSLHHVLNDIKRKHSGKSVEIQQLKDSILTAREVTRERTDTISKEFQTKCKEAGVLFIKGKAYFEDSTSIRLKDSEVSSLGFKNAIIATGSKPAHVPGEAAVFSDKIVSVETAISQIPFQQSVLIVGGGHTGLELANCYSSVYSKLEVHEQGERLLPILGDDLISHIKAADPAFFESIYLNSKVTKLDETDQYVQVETEQNGKTRTSKFDLVILANGRIPATDGLGLENTNVTLTSRGFINVESNLQTGEPHIYAIGDVTGPNMYATIAARHGEIAAEVITGAMSAFDVQAIPHTINSPLPLSWCGLTRVEAEQRNIEISIETLLWKDIPAMVYHGSELGMTQIIVAKDDGRVLGATVVGEGSSHLIREYVVAIEMGALLEDLQLIVPAHPIY